MRAGEGGEHQVPGIGLAGVHLHLSDLLIDVAYLGDVGEVQAAVHPLGVHVEGQGDQVHVARALAVAEEGGLHPFRPGQQAQLRRGHSGAPVVVGVEGDNGAVARGQLTDEVLDLVGEVVGQAIFHRGGQIEDDLVVRGGAQSLDNRLADVHGVVHLGAHKGLGGVLVA